MDVREKLALTVCNATQNTNYKCEFDCEKKGKCAYCLVMAEQMIAHCVTVQEWIPVTERLPKNYEAVLTFDGRSIHIMAHHHDFKDPFGIAKGNFMGYAPITHWMPLPEPPKGE